ncbi:MAG: BA14K family protein [Pseudaminobacter sp.]|nr:BA14K family protein [Pseudaminobacter sp.]
MRKFTSSLCAALALSLAIGTAAPVMAAPAFVPKAPAVSSDVVQVQEKRIIRRDARRDRRENRREIRRDRREDKREARRERREDRFERRGNNYYYNGRRGYRERRAGYRLYNGWWFPSAAFALGIVIGNQSNVGRVSNSHVAWCHDRWRSYRVSDNSYQPYNGPRQRCYSPFS